MKTLTTKWNTLMLILSICVLPKLSDAQCGAGFTNTQLNFDMQFLVSTALPVSPVNYAFGKNSVSLGWSGVSTFLGVTGEHTGELTSFGRGDDLKFNCGKGDVFFTFDKEVTNLTFSIYDIDAAHTITVTAKNAANTALNITMVKDSTASNTFSLTGSGGTAPKAAANSSTYNLTAKGGNVNITIAGPVKSLNINASKNSGGDVLYISDLTACNNNTTSGTFATNYQAISTPIVAQNPQILACYGDSIVAVDVVTNEVGLIYEVGNENLISANGLSTGINSLAYDPYNKVIYFCDNARISTNKSIFKYDVLTGVKTTWVTDVTTLGIQLFTNGLGSGGASFYDGALYLGQDMTSAGGSAEPVTVYRININSSTGEATGAHRVWSKSGFTGATSLYDWADFVINDGVLYNFNSSSGRAANTGLQHIDLNTQSVTAGYSLTGTIVNNSQCGIDYSGKIYHLNGTTYSVYDKSGNIGATTQITGIGTTTSTDAAESFSYPYDFGDAPLSYGRAYHLKVQTPDLMIGTKIDYELFKPTDTSAIADDNSNTGESNDEDGIIDFPSLTSSDVSYSINVNITNNTGADGYLYGYIDLNRNGVFDTVTERSQLRIVSAAGTSLVALNWTGMSGTANFGNSYIRFRLASFREEAAKPMGMARRGEVQDYNFPIYASSLPVELIEFKAEAQEKNTVLLSWSTASEFNNDYFEVLRKKGNSWFSLGKVQGIGSSKKVNTYKFIDETPEGGINYYQLKQVDFDGKTEYSPIVSVTFFNKAEPKTKVMTFYPNPTTNYFWLKTDQEIDHENPSDIVVYNPFGEKIQELKQSGQLQKIDLSEYENGMYFIIVGDEKFTILKQ